MDVYETCPRLSSAHFLLRQVCMEDWKDLLKVYSDRKSVPIFNSDNCTGDFYITRESDIRNMISFWLAEYGQRYYVRWSIVDQSSGQAVGTIELFNRISEDFYNQVGLLRLDLRSDYEREDVITELLALLVPQSWELFGCSWMATKIPPCAEVRRSAMERFGFCSCPEPLYGHDGTAYGNYYILRK